MRALDVGEAKRSCVLALGEEDEAQ